MARRKSSGSGPLRAAMFTVAGGASAAVVGHLLRDNNVKPTTVGLGLAAGGIVGAMTLSGSARWFAAGVATSGASQWTTQWAAENLKRKALAGGISVLPAGVVASRNLGRGEILEAFEEAEREVEAELGR